MRPSVGSLDGFIPSQWNFSKRILLSQGVDAFAWDAAKAANDESDDEEDEENEGYDDDGDLRGRKIDVDQRSGSGQRLHVNLYVSRPDTALKEEARQERNDDNRQRMHLFD